MASLLSSSASTPHVVAIPLPAQGHVNPMIRLCHKLASLGVLVTFVNADHIHDRLIRVQNHSDKPIEEGGEIRMVHIPIPGASLTSDFQISLEDLFMATDAMADAWGQLVTNISESGPPVTCIISDFCLSVATQHIADKLGIPRVTLMCSSQSIYLYTLYTANGRIRLEDVLLAADKGFAKDSKYLLRDLPGLPPLRYEDLATFKHVVDDTKFLFHFFGRQITNINEKSKRLLVNTFYELESAALDVTPKEIAVYPVGPLLEHSEEERAMSLWQEDQGCLQWLEKQPPNSVLYISFGSITTFSTLQMQEILLGLEASHQRFLGSLRRDVVEADSYKLLEEFVSRTEDLAYVVPWAPQTRVLSHSSVGGFLTHCGWNSVMESIAKGVPMLCWPYFADQFLDRRFIVEEWKIGLGFEAEDDGVVRREEVERVVRTLMREEVGREMRRRARELSERARLGDMAGLHMRRFVEDMKKW